MDKLNLPIFNNILDDLEEYPRSTKFYTYRGVEKTPYSSLNIYSPNYRINPVFFPVLFIAPNPVPNPVPNPNVPCYLKGTNILTTKGYIGIEELTDTDNLINHLGNKIKILHITKFNRTNHINTHPYIIPKNTKINNYICIKDLYISKDHAILFNNLFIPVRNTEFKIETNIDCNIYEYYHITTENFFTDTIIANGLPTESFGKHILKEHLCILNKISKNGIRKLLSKQEFNNIINPKSKSKPKIKIKLNYMN